MIRGLALAAVFCLASSSAGCGGAARSVGTGQSVAASGPLARPVAGETVVHGYIHGDDDGVDGDVYTRTNKGDDKYVREFGRPADRRQAQAIAAVIGGYFAAARRHDGTLACSLMVPSLADSTKLERRLPEEYRAAAGSSLLEGRPCPQVETLLFEVDRRLLAVETPSARLLEARVQGDAAVALLAFKGTGERQLDLRREGGAWKLADLLDRNLP